MGASKRRSFSVRVRGVMRAGVYVLLFSAGLLTLCIQRARAAIGKSMLALGNEALGLSVIDSEASKLRLNGEELSLMTASVDLGLARVLDEFEKACNTGDSAFRQIWELTRELPSESVARISEIGMKPGSNTFRFESEDSGVVLCFVRRPNTPARSLTETLEDVASTGEIGHFGSLRYFFARRGSERTELVSLSSDSALSLTKLTGGDGTSDVEGMDPVNIIRPPDSRRTFSVSIVGTVYNYNLYLSRESPERILSRYDQTMLKEGFGPLQAPGLDHEPTQRTYVKPMLMVIATADSTAEGTVVSLLETSQLPELATQVAPNVPGD
jgi:hypothetical protein